MASRLEEMTKAYDAPILISGALYDNLSAGTQEQCRWIDHLQPANLKEDLRLYTVDIAIDSLELEPLQAPKTKQQRRSQRVRDRLLRDNFKAQLKKGGIDISLLFEDDNDLQVMRSKFSKVSTKGTPYLLLTYNYYQEFFDTFAAGFQYYVDGDWKKARKELMKVPILKGKDDKPAQNILDYMASCNGVPPPDWNGIRKEND